jgi:hypothetical protein
MHQNDRCQCDRIWSTGGSAGLPERSILTRANSYGTVSAFTPEGGFGGTPVDHALKYDKYIL